jgi:hypothetical protein
MNPSAIPQAPQQPDQTPAWIRALPSIGGMAGSFIGGALGGVGGTAAGAAIPGADLTGVPEVAGAVGGYKLGSTVGAGLGGGIGQTAEDALTGKLNAGTLLRAGGSALENAIGNFTGEKLVQGGSMLLKGAKGLLERGAAQRAAGAAQAVDNVPWQGIANSTAAKNSNLDGTLNAMKDYGIGTHPDDLSKVLPQITGKDGAIISDLVRGAMAKSTNPVDISGTVGLANNIAGSPELASEGPTVGKAFVSTVNNILGLDKNGLTTKNAAADVYQARQLLMDKAYSKGTSDALSSAYHDVANSLDGALTRSGVDNVVGENGITPDQLKTLQGISPKLAAEVQAASQQGVGALRSLQKPFVDASNLVRAQSYHAGGQLPGAIAEKTAQAAGAGGPTLLDAASIASAPFTGGASLLGLLPHAVKIGTNPAVQDTALSAINGASNSVLSKIIPTITRAGTIAAANLPNELPQPQGGGAAGAAAAGGGVPSSIPASPLIQAYNQQVSDQGTLMDQAGRVPANFGGAGLAGAAASLGGVVANLAPQVQKQELAGQAAAGLMPAFEHAGGAQGTLGGLLTQATGLIPGSAANTYQREQETTAAALASLLGITKEEAAGLLPRLTQSQGTAANPEAVLRNILGGVNPNAGGSSIPSLNLAPLQITSGQ